MVDIDFGGDFLNNTELEAVRKSIYSSKTLDYPTISAIFAYYLNNQIIRITLAEYEAMYDSSNNRQDDWIDTTFVDANRLNVDFFLLLSSTMNSSVRLDAIKDGYPNRQKTQLTKMHSSKSNRDIPMCFIAPYRDEDALERCATMLSLRLAGIRDKNIFNDIVERINAIIVRDETIPVENRQLLAYGSSLVAIANNPDSYSDTELLEAGLSNIQIDTLRTQSGKEKATYVFLARAIQCAILRKEIIEKAKDMNPLMQELIYTISCQTTEDFINDEDTQMKIFILGQLVIDKIDDNGFATIKNVPIKGFSKLDFLNFARAISPHIQAVKKLDDGLYTTLLSICVYAYYLNLDDYLARGMDDLKLLRKICHIPEECLTEFVRNDKVKKISFTVEQDGEEFSIEHTPTQIKEDSWSSNLKIFKIKDKS